MCVIEPSCQRNISKRESPVSAGFTAGTLFSFVLRTNGYPDSTGYAVSSCQRAGTHAELICNHVLLLCAAHPFLPYSEYLDCIVAKAPSHSYLATTLNECRPTGEALVLWQRAMGERLDRTLGSFVLMELLVVVVPSRCCDQ